MVPIGTFGNQVNCMIGLSTYPLLMETPMESRMRTTCTLQSQTSRGVGTCSGYGPSLCHPVSPTTPFPSKVMTPQGST